MYDEIHLLIKRIELDGWDLLLKYQHDKSNSLKSSRHTQHYVTLMLNYIAEHFNEVITVAQVAGAVGLNSNYAMGIFQSIMKLTIKQYITTMRINHAKALLSDTDKTMLDISLTAGFNSLSRFYDNFQKHTGLSPMSYRKQVRGIWRQWKTFKIWKFFDRTFVFLKGIWIIKAMELLNDWIK